MNRDWFGNRWLCFDAQAVFCRRRHQPRRPPLARIRPGRPAPAMGPGELGGLADGAAESFKPYDPMDIGVNRASFCIAAQCNVVFMCAIVRMAGYARVTIRPLLTAEEMDKAVEKTPPVRVPQQQP